jgi:hypothetical protein
MPPDQTLNVGPWDLARLRARALVEAELANGWFFGFRDVLYYLTPDGLDFIRASGDPFALALALAELAWTKTEFVREDALRYAEEAAAIASEIGDPWLIAYARLAHGAALAFARRERHAGIESLRVGLAQAQRTGDRWLAAYAAWTIGIVLLELEQYVEASARFMWQRAQYLELRVHLGLEWAAWGLSAAAVGSGDIDSAREYTGERARYAAAATNLGGLTWTLIYSAIVAMEQGDFAATSDAFQQARAVLARCDRTSRQYLSVLVNLALGAWDDAWFACAQGDLARAQQVVAQFERDLAEIHVASQNHNEHRMRELPAAEARLRSLVALVAGDTTQAQHELMRAPASSEPFAFFHRGLVASRCGAYTLACESYMQFQSLPSISAARPVAAEDS